MSAAGKSAPGFGGPQLGGGPAPVQQPDIYARMGGQPMVDSDPNAVGFQPPTSSPMQPPAQVQPMPTPGMPGGKSGPPGLSGLDGYSGKGGFQGGPYVPRPDIGPGVGFGPGLPDPNAPNTLGPDGQQPITTQPPGGAPSFGGKGGFGDVNRIMTVMNPPQPFNPTDTYR